MVGHRFGAVVTATPVLMSRQRRPRKRSTPAVSFLRTTAAVGVPWTTYAEHAGQPLDISTHRPFCKRTVPPKRGQGRGVRVTGNATFEDEEIHLIRSDTWSPFPCRRMTYPHSVGRRNTTRG